MCLALKQFPKKKDTVLPLCAAAIGMLSVLSPCQSRCESPTNLRFVQRIPSDSMNEIKDFLSSTEVWSLSWHSWTSGRKTTTFIFSYCEHSGKQPCID